MKIRIATRGSRLARTQSQWVADEIARIEPRAAVELITITTKGDRITDRPLSQVGGKGLFVAEVEAAVATGAADIAVHSLKDVPGDIDLATGLILTSTPLREDPRDVLITNTGLDLASLPRDARIGTSSLRRTVQLKAQRPDLQFVSLRGNVDTRMKKLEHGEIDAIVLAASGLRRLGLFESTKLSILPEDVCIPAVGQGTLAIEARQSDEALCELLGQLQDKKTRIATEAERALLRKLEGNCHSPIAGYARFSDDGERLILNAIVASADADLVLSSVSDHYLKSEDEQKTIDGAKALGREAAENLLSQGAHRLIEEAQAASYRRQRLSN